MADLRVLSNELLPCPFCGGDAHLAWYYFRDKVNGEVVAECENLHCLSAVCGSKTPEEAIARWNNRAKHNGLKPCPFCGSVAVLDKFDNGECDMYQVVCSNPKCGAETISSNKPEDVITIWNRRINEEGDVY